jgi:uncharacterized membrane protein
MKKERFETFTDGVFAIIITLMVLEIKLPELTADNFWILVQHITVYALSFMVIAITWLNHHNMFLPTDKITTKIIWINFGLLFTLSLVPLATGPLGEHFHKRESHIFYGAVLTAVSLFYTLLQNSVNTILIHVNDKDKKHINKTNWLATTLYALSIPLSFLSIYISTIIFIMFPIIYFIPSKRLTKLE